MVEVVHPQRSEVSNNTKWFKYFGLLKLPRPMVRYVHILLSPNRAVQTQLYNSPSVEYPPKLLLLNMDVPQSGQLTYPAI